MAAGRIDLFSQLKAFRYLCITNALPGITGNHRSVYVALVMINNATMWSEYFEVDFEAILNESKVDKETYRKAMDFLNENGLFDSYVKGVNKWARAKVSLKVLTDNSTGNSEGKQYSNPEGITVGKPVSNPEGKQASTQYNNKTVNKETINNETKKQYIRDSEFEISVLKFFGFNEIANYDKMKLLSECCRSLTNRNQYDYFKNQTIAYIAYKEVKKFPHSMPVFLGSQSELFMDGAWNKENWEKKLKDENISSGGIVVPMVPAKLTATEKYNLERKAFLQQQQQQ